MATYAKFEVWPENFVDANGAPYSAGTLTFVATGTSTPAAVHSDDSGTALSNGVTVGVVNLNSRGVPETAGGTSCEIYGDTSVIYDLILKDSSGTTIDTYEKIRATLKTSVADVTEVYDSFAAAYAGSNTGINIVKTRSFYPGWAGTVAGPKGGGLYHRDGTTGTASTAYADNSGFYDANGDGFMLSTSGTISPSKFGASTAIADNATAINNCLKFIWENYDNASVDLFNSGLSRGFIYADFEGMIYSVKSAINLVDPTSTGSGGAGGHAGVKNGGIQAAATWAGGDELFRITAVNSNDWVEQNFARDFVFDCNRLVNYGVRGLKTVGCGISNCYVTRYLSRGVYTDTLTFNFNVSKCYIEAFPFGTYTSSTQQRTDAPDYGVYFGNSDNTIDNGTVIIGNIYAANCPGKTRIIGNHFYGNRYSIKYDSQFAMIHGNYLEDPILSSGLADATLMGNFHSESNRGACIIVTDDGSGNGRGSSVIGPVVSNYTWTVTGDLTLSATSGSAITVTSTESDFNEFVTTGHVSEGAVITETGGDGLAIVTADISTTQVTAQVINAFSTTSLASGAWDIDRSGIAVIGSSTNLSSGLVKLGNLGRNEIASGQEISGISIGGVDAIEVSSTMLKTPKGADATIAAGVISAAGSSYLRIDTESSAASDDLDTISGGEDGQRLLIRPVSASRTVVIKDGTGNIAGPGDISLDNSQDTCELVYDSTAALWFVISTSNNGA